MNSMNGNIFIDTNIVVYAFDASDEKKHKTAGRLLNDAFRSKDVAISTQVLKEFFVTVTKKIQRKMDLLEAKEIIKRLALLQVVETTVPLVLRGIDIQRENRISFWDAIIVAAAGASNCTTILSENLSHDTIIEGIHIKNPFLPIP